MGNFQLCCAGRGGKITGLEEGSLPNLRTFAVFIVGGLFLMVAGCQIDQTVPLISETQTAAGLLTEIPQELISTPSPVKILEPTLTPSPTDVPVQIGPIAPDGLGELIDALPGMAVAEVGLDASLQVDLLMPGEEGVVAVEWVYALVAPFPTIQDQLSLEELRSVWRGEPAEGFGGAALLVSEETRQVFGALWGPADSEWVLTVDPEELLDTAWEVNTWVLLPFDELKPRWKVLRVDNISPIDKVFDVTAYPLAARFGVFGGGEGLAQLAASGAVLPLTNRDAAQMTDLLLTGVTALVRYTALKMEQEGLTYPGEDIRGWLWYPDFTHISNEVPFYEECPPAVPLRLEARFCSDARYLELFRYTGVDVIELTGNHIHDWGPEAFSDTLDLYNREGYLTYGGGKDFEDARQPLLIEHNGNRLALIGCNSVGPENVWATAEQAGAAQCDMEWLIAEIGEMRNQGYLPVVTFQHFELCDWQPQSAQRVDFLAAAEAGAVVISGSQAHCPQTMTFVGDSFVHFGLGNLFFDQMDEVTRPEFLDRHIFYQGRYISTQLLTAILEDFARPRPMTINERTRFLGEAFTAAGWQIE
jgi:hypothetical protein